MTSINFLSMKLCLLKTSSLCLAHSSLKNIYKGIEFSYIYTYSNKRWMFGFWTSIKITYDASQFTTLFLWHMYFSSMIASNNVNLSSQNKKIQKSNLHLQVKNEIKHICSLHINCSFGTGILWKGKTLVCNFFYNKLQGNLSVSVIVK